MRKLRILKRIIKKLEDFSLDKLAIIQGKERTMKIGKNFVLGLLKDFLWSWECLRTMLILMI